VAESPVLIEASPRSEYEEEQERYYDNSNSKKFTPAKPVTENKGGTLSYTTISSAKYSESEKKSQRVYNYI
jgi:hypothetical protein